jgi:hypothetical protein
VAHAPEKIVEAAKEKDGSRIFRHPASTPQLPKTRIE